MLLKLTVSIFSIALPSSGPGPMFNLLIASGPVTVNLNALKASSNCDGIPSLAPKLLIWSSVTPEVCCIFF